MRIDKQFFHRATNVIAKADIRGYRCDCAWQTVPVINNPACKTVSSSAGLFDDLHSPDLLGLRTKSFLSLLL